MMKIFEEKLKDKVDQMGLDNLARILEGKITNEMLKKLDINDLKRNNKLIDQKIDLIENKISRVLIDTLIDLQNEETPLLVKQTGGNEKCMSCNQNIVINNTNIFNGTQQKEKKKNKVSELKESQIREKDVKEMQINNVITNNLNTGPNINLNTSKNFKKKNLDPIITLKNKNTLTESELKRQYREMISEEVKKSNLDGNKLVKKASNMISKALET